MITRVLVIAIDQHTTQCRGITRVLVIAIGQHKPWGRG